MPVFYIVGVPHAWDGEMGEGAVRRGACFSDRAFEAGVAPKGNSGRVSAQES